MRVTRRLAAVVTSTKSNSSSTSGTGVQQRLAQELRKLLPFLPKTTPLSQSDNKSSNSESAPTTTNMSAAALIIATAHCTSRAQVANIHGTQCAVQSADIPLSALAGNSALATRCGFCVQRRVHYLASELFCLDFAQRCQQGTSAKGKEGSNSAAVDMPPALRDAILDNFPSVPAFLDEFALFVRSAHTPGRTWLVYKPPNAKPSTESNTTSTTTTTTTKSSSVIPVMHGVVLMNLSLNETPLVFGLWPLAVIDATERNLCALYDSRRAECEQNALSADTTLHTAQSYPAWSRAARNPAAAMVEYISAQDRRMSEQIPHSLDALRRALAQRALRDMNWDFVASQLATAVQYYSSTRRQTWQAAQKQRLTQRVVSEAIKLYNSHTNDEAESDTTTTTSNSIAAPAEPRVTAAADASREKRSAIQPQQEEELRKTEVKDTAEVKDGTVKKSEGTASAETQRSEQQQEEKDTSATISASKEERPSQMTTPKESNTHSGEKSVEEPVVVQREDGTWEYRFPNGDVTLVHTDGRKVFITAAVRTTTFPDGSMLFEYPNGSSIHDTADGTRVTTFADGTVKTERRPES